MWSQAKAALEDVEAKSGRVFGSTENPLLVSVRSGAVTSMAGMMDTVLNLGLNDDTIEGLAQLSGNRRFALNAYRHFITMFGNLGWDSGTGVAFTCNPSTGENKSYGEYRLNAQGEDVVAGIRTPHPIAHLAEDMQADLIDEYHLILQPVIFGQRYSLFP